MATVPNLFSVSEAEVPDAIQVYSHWSHPKDDLLLEKGEILLEEGVLFQKETHQESYSQWQGLQEAEESVWEVVEEQSGLQVLQIQQQLPHHRTRQDLQVQSCLQRPPLDIHQGL
jgi:hypothetical protein